MSEDKDLNQPDYVLDRCGNRVRVGDLVTAAGVPDVLLVTAVDSKINWLSAIKAIRDNPCAPAITIKGKDATLIKSNHNGGDDV